MTRPRRLFCDFGNVLAFFDHHKAARELAALAVPPLDAGTVYDSVFSTMLEEDYDSGRLSTLEFIDQLRRRLGLRARDDQIANAWSDIYTANPPMADLIADLKRRGVQLVLASNTNEVHYQWFRPRFARTLDLFNDEVLSFRVGCRKPDVRFFEACLHASGGAPPGDCLYVDDRADFIDVARAMGIPGVVYQPGGEPGILRAFGSG